MEKILASCLLVLLLVPGCAQQEAERGEAMPETDGEGETGAPNITDEDLGIPDEPDSESLDGIPDDGLEELGGDSEEPEENATGVSRSNLSEDDLGILDDPDSESLDTGALEEI